MELFVSDRFVWMAEMIGQAGSLPHGGSFDGFLTGIYTES
jgi:hypothetical protein